MMLRTKMVRLAQSLDKLTFKMHDLKCFHIKFVENVFETFAMPIVLKVYMLGSYLWVGGHLFCSLLGGKTHLKQLFHQPRGNWSSLGC